MFQQNMNCTVFLLKKNGKDVNTYIARTLIIHWTVDAKAIELIEK